MKKIYVSLLLSALIFFLNSPIFSQSNYIILGNLGTTSFCPSGTLPVPFITDLPAGTVFRVYLSNASGSFTSQTQIGSGTVSPITATFPSSVSSGTGYLIRIVSVSPSVTSSLSNSLTTNGQAMTISVKNLVGKEINGGSICQNSALTGTISSNQSGITYEWKKDGVSQTTNNSLRMTQTGNYVASIQKVGCSINLSKSFNLSFNSTIYHSISLQGEENQCAGSSVLLRDSYYSDSTIYQWKKDGINLTTVAQDTLFATQTGKYEVLVTDKCSVIDGMLNNFKKILFSNSIENRIYSSTNRTELCGNNTYLNLYSKKADIINKNPYAPYSYQWKKNSIAISGATQNSLFIYNASGLYNLVLSQGSCTTISDAINVTKVDTIRLGLNIGEPYKSETCNSLNVLLNTSYLSGISLSFYKNGVQFSPSQINYFYATTSGKYNIGGTATNCVVLPSDTVKITISNKIKPSIFAIGNVLCSGNSTSLAAWSSLYSSLPNVSHQWYRNNVAIPNTNRNQINYIDQAGFYKVKVTSDDCSGFSDSVQINVVSQIPKPTILLFSNKIACNNALLQLDIRYRSPTEIGTEAIYDSLLWKKNGIIIDRKKRNAETLYTYINQSGTYTVVGKQGTCQTESDPVEIKIGEPITANITGSTSIYPGQKAKLNLNFTGGNAWSYQTSDVATEQTTSNSPTLKNVSPSSTQTYSITSVASNCGVGAVTGNATVTVLPCPTDKTISINSGNWNTATTWTCGQIPTAAYDAIIENGHTVSLPNGYQGNTKKLELKGNLSQGAGASVWVSN